MDYKSVFRARATCSYFDEMQSDLLSYNARHKVLICRECKYAIQKSALESHLLRHKIYRGDRRRLLDSIAELQLLEPDEVQFPPAESSRIDELPVIEGFRCTADGCENLCASLKRMRRHWSETHGISDPPDSCARTAKLQTFFRGTKLRYFEIESPISVETVPRINTSVPWELDLDTLQYFHHFTTTTSLTLPSEDQNAVRHGQTEVVAQALQARWLMGGLLALSASHLSTISEATKRLHLERAARFHRVFASGWEDLKRGLGGITPEEAKTGALVASILGCWHWISETASGMAQLESFATIIQDCVNLIFALRSEGITGIPESTLQSDNAMDPRGPNTAPPALVEQLRRLPYRMAEVLGKPENALNFFATMSAIDLLVGCCSLSYASNNVAAAWAGMETWLRTRPDRFESILRDREPAALIALACWTILVERAESYCWFLKGSASKVLRLVKSELTPNFAAQKLVDTLISEMREVSVGRVSSGQETPELVMART